MASDTRAVPEAVVISKLNVSHFEGSSIIQAQFLLHSVQEVKAASAIDFPQFISLSAAHYSIDPRDKIYTLLDLIIHYTSYDIILC